MIWEVKTMEYNPTLLEKGRSRAINTLVGAGWGLFLYLIVLSIYFQRVYFEIVIQDTNDYILILGLWLGITVFGSLLLPRIPTKFLVLCILLVAGLTGLVWLFYALQLPVEYPEDRNCQSWDCDLFLGLLRRCDSWTCQKPGVILLILLSLSLMPIIWLEWIQRTTLSLQKKDVSSIQNRRNISALITIALIFGILGGIALLAYYIVAFLSAWLWLLLGFLPIIVQGKIGVGSSNVSEIEQSKPVIFDLPHIVHNLIYLAALSVFMFSVGTRNFIPVSIFWQIGIGLLLAAMLYLLIVKSHGIADWEVIIRWIEIFVFFSLFIACAMGMMIFEHEIEIRLKFGVSPFVMGFMLSYLVLRWNHFGDGLNLTPSMLAFRVPLIKDPNFRLLLNNTIIMMGFIVAIIQIIVDAVSAILIYGIGLVLATVGLFASLGSLINQKKN
jgi:hypothetical protein